MNARTRHILLAGCGDLGSHVGLQLASSGHEVTGVRRSPAPGRLPFPVRAMDLADPRGAQLPDADAVIVALTADSRDAPGYERAYRRTLQGLAEALPEDAAPHVVFVSSTSVLGRHEGRVTEETPAQPGTDTAEVLLEAERDARKLFETVTVLRPAGIYGPGRTRTLQRVLSGAPADHGLMTNRIHRDDLVDAIVAVLGSPAPPELLHAVDTEPATQGEVMRFLAGRLGVPVPEDTGDGIRHGRTIDAHRLHTMLGEGGLSYPTYREGYARLIETMPDLGS